VLLVGWDAADWKVIRPLMDSGRMPNLQRLVREGASGRIATLHPPLSPMLWTSIATGKRPFQHGIHGFTEPMPDGSGVRPVTNLSRTSKALWNILSQSGLRSIVIGWWPSHPAEPIRGVMVSDRYHRASRPLHEGWPLPADTVHPQELADALAALRVHPDQLTPAMVEPFIPLAREIDQERDKRLAAFLRTLAECRSIQAAATWLLDGQPWDFFAVYFEALDHFCHSFMRYHPPRQSWIGARDFELYHNVVSMACQFHDEMLGALLAKAGEDTTVIVMSDHGFHPDHLRPSSIPDIPAGPAIEHRDFGVLAIRGPRIKKDAALDGASVLDIAPTILTLLRLPVGEDMDGKVLSQAFADSPGVTLIPSWEEVPGADGRHSAHARLDPIASGEAMEQLIALGYIERPSEDREAAIAGAVRDLRYNLAESWQDAGRHAEAHEILLDLCKAVPDEQRFAVRLFVSCQALGSREEMRRIVDDLDGRRHQPRQQPAVTDYLKAQMLIAEKRYDEALAALEQVTGSRRVRPELLLQTADLYLRLRRVAEARETYEKALAMDPDSVPAHIGLCRIALRKGEFSGAANLALDALQRTYHDPLPHFLLGRALAGMEEYQRAAEAFRAAISLNPNFPQAHARLATLLENHLGDGESAREHRRLARAMRNAARPPLRPPIPIRARAQAVLRASATDARSTEMPPLSESLIVVTGLPRSGTSMLMQMLAAGGMNVLSDELRAADEDNPRGYLEYEPVKRLLKDSSWLREACGKAVKIVAPLLTALPPDLPCRVLLVERDLDEVLDSQDRMLLRRSQSAVTTSERRRALKDEYRRILDGVKSTLAQRALTKLLVIDYTSAIADPRTAAEALSYFLDTGLDAVKMAAAVDPALHRNRAIAATGDAPVSP